MCGCEKTRRISPELTVLLAKFRAVFVENFSFLIGGDAFSIEDGERARHAIADACAITPGHVA